VGSRTNWIYLYPQAALEVGACKSRQRTKQQVEAERLDLSVSNWRMSYVEWNV
jgi:hypothetical protein